MTYVVANVLQRIPNRRPQITCSKSTFLCRPSPAFTLWFHLMWDSCFYLLLSTNVKNKNLISPNDTRCCLLEKVLFISKDSKLWVTKQHNSSLDSSDEHLRCSFKIPKFSSNCISGSFIHMFFLWHYKWLKLCKVQFLRGNWSLCCFLQGRMIDAIYNENFVLSSLFNFFFGFWEPMVLSNNGSQIV